MVCFFFVINIYIPANAKVFKPSGVVETYHMHFIFVDANLSLASFLCNAFAIFV